MELQDGAINLTEQQVDALAGEQLTKWSVTTNTKEQYVKRLGRFSRHAYLIEPLGDTTYDSLDFFNVIGTLAPKIKAEGASIKLLERKVVLFEFPLEKRIKLMAFETPEFKAVKIRIREIFNYVPNYGLI